MIENVERWIRGAGGLTALIILLIAIEAIWTSLRRPQGRSIGQAGKVLQWPVLITQSMLFAIAGALLWRPLPLELSFFSRSVLLIIGSVFYFVSLGVYLWGLKTLGQMFGVGSSIGVRLHADQKLITNGPFTYVRHPMYLALIFAALGGLLLYRTWTLIFILFTFFGLAARARQEEKALSAEFGEEWEAYRRRVRAWIPRFKPPKDERP